MMQKEGVLGEGARGRAVLLLRSLEVKVQGSTKRKRSQNLTETFKVVYPTRDLG